MILMKILGKGKGNIGLKKIRKHKMADLYSNHRKIALRVFKTVIMKMAKLLVPHDFQTLIAEIFCLFDIFTKEKEHLVRSLDLCLKGSQGKRLLRIILAGTLGHTKQKEF